MFYEARTPDFFVSLTGASFIIDPDGRIIRWSDGATELTGMTEAESLGRQVSDMVHARDHRGRKMGTPGCEVFRLADAHSPIRPFEAEILDAAGSPMRVRCVIMNVDAGTDAGRYLVFQLHPLTETDAPRVMPERAPVPGRSRLTARENEVLRLLAQGRGTADIGKELAISPTTARNHIQSILRKLGVHSRLQAAAWAYRRGLV